MLAEILATSLMLTAVDELELVGTWQNEPVQGVATLRLLTFTQDGRLLADGIGPLGYYQVVGTTVTATSPMGTAVYELTRDGRLCVPEQRNAQPAAGAGASSTRQTVCYRKVAQPT